MKKLFFLILGCSIMLSCSDNFIENYKTELLKKRAEGKTFALVTGTTIISFTEYDPGGTGQPGIFKAKLSAPPESNVVLDFTKANQLCTTPGVEETLKFNPTTLVFTPGNYNQEQEVEITVDNDMLVNETRGHRVILPPLESFDPLYNGVGTPTLYVTVFEDDTRPIAYPVTPYIGQQNVPEYDAIIVTFNREMDENSINENSFMVTDQRGNTISGYIWLGSDKKTAYFTPKQYLRNGISYTVDISKSIKDTYGNELISGLSWEFRANVFQPALRGSYNISDPYGWAYDVAVVDDYAYVAYGKLGLQIIDIILSNPDNPHVEGSWDSTIVEDVAEAVTVLGNYAYVGYNTTQQFSGLKGLKIIDIQNPSKPDGGLNYNSNYCQTEYFGADVAVVGDYAYVADGYNGLKIINISDLDNLYFVGQWYSDKQYSFAKKVTVDGNYAYIAADFAGLEIINISQPEEPYSVGAWDTVTNNQANSVAIVGNYAYIAFGYSGLQIVDISNPASPAFVGKYVTSDFAQDVAVVGDYAYIADRETGLKVIDVNNPVNPILVGHYDTDGTAESVTVVGDFAYIADEEQGLQIINISNPASPYWVNSWNINEPDYDAMAITAVGNYVYVADGNKGLKIIDVSNPSSPERIEYNYNGTVFGIAVSRGYAFVSDYDYGLQIIRIPYGE